MSDDDASGHDRRSEPVTLRVRSVSPALTVDDLDGSLAWYRDVLGCHVGDTWEEEGRVLGAELSLGATSVVLSQDDGAKGRDRRKGVGFRLYLTTAQDVDELASDFVERGGELESGPAELPWGPRAFSVVDPDGFKLTIVAEA